MRTSRGFPPTAIRRFIGAQRAVCSCLVLLLIACACNAKPTLESVEAKVMDSAGVQLIDFPRLPTVTGAVQLAKRPTLDLGGLHDNDSLEFDARGIYFRAAVLADGQIVVGDHTRLKFFDGRGRLIRIAGRAGAGPGEFSNIRDLCPQLDSSLLVIDDNGSWSVWDRLGRLQHTQARLGSIPYNGCSAYGNVLVSEASMVVDYNVSKARTLLYGLYNLDGAYRQSLGRLAAPEYYGPIFFEPSFGFIDGELLIGDNKQFEIRTQSFATGRVTRQWRVHNALRLLTDDEWEKIIAETTPRNLTESQRSKRYARLQELGKPSTFPAFMFVRVDPLGRIWISPYSLQRLHWYVIDSNGTRLSMVPLPFPASARPELTGFAGESVVIRYFDDDGAVHLGFFHVDTTGSGRK